MSDPEDKWLSDKSWGDLLGVGTGFPDVFGWVRMDFKSRTQNWRRLCETSNPLEMMRELFMPSHPELTDFHYLMLLRCVRPDMVIGALQLFVQNNMGERFVNPPSFDLSVSYEGALSVSCYYVRDFDAQN